MDIAQNLAVQLLCHKLRPPMDQAFGSGFVILIGGRHWLITAAHNVEDREKDFAGAPDYDVVSMMRPLEGGGAGGSGILLNDGRAVLYAEYGGTLIDFLAVALSKDEVPDGLSVLQIDEQVEVPGRSPETPSDYKLEVAGKYGPKPGQQQILSIGYANPHAANAPLVVEGVTSEHFPTLHSRAITFSPGAAKGVSGGPIFGRTSGNLGVLIGVHTHSATTSFELFDAAGRQFHGSVMCGHGTSIDVAQICCSLAATNGLQTIPLS